MNKKRTLILRLSLSSGKHLNLPTTKRMASAHTYCNKVSFNLSGAGPLH